MIDKPRKSRVGLGQKPRGVPQVRTLSTEPVGVVDTSRGNMAVQASTDAVQQAEVKQPVSEPEKQVETPSTLEPETVQNLDSADPAIVAASDGLDEALERSKGPEFVFGMTGFKELPNVEFAEKGFVDPPQMRNPQFGEQGLDTNPETGCISNEGLAAKESVVGERPDGTFGLVITIPEGMIEPIRQQAEADKITPEDWVSTRLLEYIESWWQPAQSR